MVLIMPAGVKYPCTDKGTIVRPACYKQYEAVIENAYQKFESRGISSRLILDICELQNYLLKLLLDRIGIAGLDLHTDFFAAGMDSLQAITSRAYILRELELDGQTLGQNLMFEFPSIAKLATYLHAVQTGSSIHNKSNDELMQDLVAKYSAFKPFQGGHRIPDAEVVVSTF
jgi:hypothetical protein